MSTETQNNEQQVSGQNPASDSQQPSVSVYNMTDREKWLAFISYIWLLFILSALLAENSPYIKFHVNQSLWVFILFQVSGYIIAMIPFVNCVILPVLIIASLVYMVLGLINAWQGKMEPLPFFDRLPVLYQ
ncbi:MAG: hypothetical protein KatS3mg084_0312 [Candidatus Dojkabacteria bacterium]|nr:MAG: hypothetical protein KatS3mg084_0312 [Candidatus Dojkabacteria bacterium]